ncbi:unnamed protein product [Dicrocoelium dendriticum]|nr:unnamed protein product [Dicrocoelium dendriticum]
MRLSPFLFYCSSRVILLQSGDIFRNLAFEAALFTDNERFHTQDRSRTAPTDILMWRSDPCVVIGRFQNAWKECNLDFLRANQWLLARRQSGGGSVFHDRDNLNVSFMQARSVLNRRNCMEFLQSVLQRLVPAKKIIIGDRFDLWQADAGENGLASAKRKISGSASRLGAKVAYHHCTLLCETNLNNLSEVLSPTFKTLRSKSTDSVRSPVANIGLSVEELERSIIDDSLEWLIKVSRLRLRSQKVNLFKPVTAFL